MGIERLVLGTAALGEKPYGGESLTGEEATRVIECARNLGIKHFDTAPSYGNAELRLSRVLSTYERHITTKTHGDRAELLQSLNYFRGATSLRVLWHMRDANDTPPADWHMDVSYYGADTTAQYWKGQVDWNLLNQTPYCGTDLDIRSVFLRGLLGDGANRVVVPNHLREAVDACCEWAGALGIPVWELALRAALQNSSARVIVGCTSVGQLKLCAEIAGSKPIPLGPIRLLHIGPEAADPRKW